MRSSSIICTLNGDNPENRLTIRICGIDYVLLEYDPVRLSLKNRAHLYRIEQILRQMQPEGIRTITGGISALMVSYSHSKLPLERLAQILRMADREARASETDEIPSRIINLPIAFHDSRIQASIAKYTEGIRSTAPYLPDNLEYLARCNGLAGAAEAEKVILAAEYMVFGLGDVYMGAPCAVPLDYRHRLCAPKYNPPRTQTPVGAVGIGGSFLSIYPIESPGGYQLIGRTVPIWNRHQLGSAFKDSPWLLRPFDRIRFFAVDEKHLNEICSQVETGRYSFNIDKAELRLSKYYNLWDKNSGADFNQYK